MPVKQPLLSVQDLTVAFPSSDTPVLRGVHFTLEAGEILGICGESGSGKSLTALSLMNLLPPEAQVSGSLILQGRELSRLPEAEWRKLRGDKLALVFQDAQTALNPTMRIGRQVEESLVIHHPELPPPERQERVRHLLTDLGLPETDLLVRAYPHELSGGMRQRVGLALALINQPDLLLVDEPTTALDASLQKQLLRLLADYREQSGHGLIFISHDIRLVRHLCDRVLIYYAGQIVETGPVDQVLSRPGHYYTQGLLAAMPGQKDRQEPLWEIPGTPPDQEKIESEEGCLFAGRCPGKKPICLQQKPPFQCVGEGHRAACHFAVSLSREQPQKPPEVVTKRTSTPKDQLPTPYLKVEHVSHSYTSRDPEQEAELVLRDINFRIYPRQFTALVGESGSGKSTLARIISGQMKPLQGQVYLAGQEITRMSRAERRQADLGIQMIFQDPYSSLHPRQKIGRQVEEPLLLQKWGTRQQRRDQVIAMIEDVGLNKEVLERYPEDLSGGQQQRVAIACALITHPKLLIADEAVSALDLSVQAQILNLFRQLRRKQQFACLYISHDLDVVRYLCDRVVVLYRGQICEEDKTERLFRHPQHPYTRHLLDASGYFAF